MYPLGNGNKSRIQNLFLTNNLNQDFIHMAKSIPRFSFQKVDAADLSLQHMVIFGNSFNCSFIRNNCNSYKTE